MCCLALATSALHLLVALGPLLSSATGATPTATVPWSLSLRRLTSELVDVPVDPEFSWDGSNSDLAQQYYALHSLGRTQDSMGFVTAELPASIQARLEAVGLDFEELPGLLQRAVVWDSGYTLDKESNFIQVYTTGGVSMAEIAVTKDEYDSSGCTTTNCSDPSRLATFRSETCSGDMMLSVSHCASEEVSVQGGHTAMWATGGNPDAVPRMEMVRHSWFDNVYLKNYLVFAIHAVANSAEPSWETCPDGYGALIVPCALYSADNADENDWQVPTPGALTTAWLLRTKQLAVPAFRLILLAPILLVGFGIGLGGLMYYRWRRSRMQPSKSMFYQAGATLLSPAHGGGGRRGRRGGGDTIKWDKGASNLESSVDFQWSYGYPSSTSSLVRALVTDPCVREKRVSMEKLHFQRQIATGAFGEVWLCELEDTAVAVKRLLRSRKQTFDDVQTFLDEIQLTSSLHHPNVVEFIAVAWTTLESVCMVLEYLPRGDLQGYLRDKTADGQLTWRGDKLRFALGVARALSYLHARQPSPLIHRDIKARNVLLTETFEVKLIDFGVSRSFAPGSSMTMGVGTPFWTAPEVLDGSVYSEQSDIYSFGVLLSELDTGAAPYQDARPANHGSTLQPFHILKLVMTGCLHPNFSPSCPSGVQSIAERCLLRDPAQRPSAKEVSGLLEALDGPELEERDLDTPSSTDT